MRRDQPLRTTPLLEPLPGVLHRYFRFRKEDMPDLLHELHFPLAPDGMVKVYGGYSFSPMELLCTFLCRMGYPSTWDRLLPILGGASPSRYKGGFYFALDHIYTQFKHCIDDITRWAGYADEWADAIHEAGAPAPRCIGFIDGTFRPCARPSRNQRQVYFGYKKLHGLKFQSVIAPNGLIVDLYGCVVGRRGDGYLLGRSQFLGRIAQLCGMEGSAFYVYGDPAYALSQYTSRCAVQLWRIHNLVCRCFLCIHGTQGAQNASRVYTRPKSLYTSWCEEVARCIHAEPCVYTHYQLVCIHTSNLCIHI